ncbi:DUF4286 family protein [Maribacter sp. CXY002]|uniref:DUF4286 family protein n=1 Tax=Maribacter luteocoastalis TaxID=3407671 RepID=UPI003B66E440
MYIYNVTTNVEDSAHDTWLNWMKTKHIPEVLGTGKFLSAKLTKVLVDEESGGHTYSVQYTAKNKKTLVRYYNENAPRLREEAMQLFAGKLISFRTELEVIDEYFVQHQSATHYLFTYGTLLEKEVQVGVFSRVLGGIADTLFSHKISQMKVADIYPTIEFTGKNEDMINGVVYTLTHDELMKADEYEGEAYERTKIVLDSGKKAWVYMAR